MPNYFSLTPRNDPGNGPMDFQTIDAGICSYLGIPVDDKKWAANWYNAFGMSLACGASLNKLERNLFKQFPDFRADDGFYYEQDVHLLLIARFLDDNYLTDAYYMGI